MTDAEQREAARQFVNRWMGKGKEDEDGRSYWIDLLTNVLGMDNVTERLNFEKKVVIDGNTKRIDVYIPETRVIIEQKSLGKALDQKIRNSGDVDLTPFEQADRYNGKLTFDERARWIVTSNFAEIWIYDMNQKQPEPTKIALDELQSKYPLLDFLVKKEVKTISHEMEVSIKAGDIVGLIYDAFLKQYRIPDIKEKDETFEQKEKRECRAIDPAAHGDRRHQGLLHRHPHGRPGLFHHQAHQHQRPVRFQHQRQDLRPAECGQGAGGN